MSIHCHNPKTTKSLRIERNRQLLGSIMLSISTVAMIMGILSLFLLMPEPQTTAELTVVTYLEKQDKDDQPEKKQPKETVPKKPSAPTSHVSKIIHSQAVSNVSVPVHEIDVQVPSVEFGESLDFGQGSGKGAGRGHGHMSWHREHRGQVVSYDDAKASVRRVAYVIEKTEHQRSGKKDRVLNELSRSLAELDENMHYQLLFYNIEPWYDDETYHAKSKYGMNLKPPGWLKASDAQKNESCAYLRKTPIWEWGPRFQGGMDRALQMDPKPNVIFFITDGDLDRSKRWHSITNCAVHETRALASNVGNKAKSQDTIINCVVVMQPTSKEASAIYKLSDLTGGTYVRIEKDGNRYDYQGNRINSDPSPVQSDPTE